METISCIELQDIAAAKKLCGKIEKMTARADNKSSDEVFFLGDMVRTETALLSGDTALFERLLARTMERLSGMPRLNSYIEEVVQFGNFLLAHDITEPVKQMLTVPTLLEAGTTHAARGLAVMAISCYEKTGDSAAAEAYRRKRRMLSEKLEQEQSGMYLYSIELIRTMKKMRQESERVNEENRQLFEQSHTDALTGIPNRLMMNSRLEQCFEKAYASGKRFGLEILDINFFKEYNDTYGHRAGDECLIRIAQVIAHIAEKEGAHCARYGGDEFVLIFENRTDEEILACAATLEEEIRKLHIVNRSAHYRKYVTVSQGICNDVPSKKNKSYDFLAEADRALYEVKGRIADGKTDHSVCLRHLPDLFS